MKPILVVLMLLLPRLAAAHPHVFVDASAGLRFDAEGRLAGLRITWLYDAFTTLNLYVQLGLDADNDGALDAGDLAKIAEGETDWPPDYPGDTYLFLDGAPVALARPENGTARMEDDRVEVSFDLDLAAPLEVAGHAASLKLYDPEYFYAYTLGTVLDSALPAGCRTEVIPFEPDAADKALRRELAALSAEEVPDDPQIGARFADELRLTCG
ncbi:DUF1007 family protein [Poseidonocella sp. HB161398]|uniref:DUF1007 family protein n=1 Tax=Poseidonocella sp. HB161398 TaxID=2320855 RepID=UPI00110884DC|nr:DUF1007 family protein [Poseidonocella sp. HB161398]